MDILGLETPKQGRYVRLAIHSAYPFVPGFTFSYAILGEVVASIGPAAAPQIAIAVQSNGDVTLTFTGATARE